MFVNVRGVQREGFSGVWRAGRFFSSTEPQRLEVTKHDEDPDMVDEDLHDPVTGVKTGSRKVHHPTKIGKKTYEALKADGRITSWADGETDTAGSAAAVEAARRVASDLGDRVAALEAENASLKEQLAELGHAKADHKGGHKK